MGNPISDSDTVRLAGIEAASKQKIAAAVCEYRADCGGESYEVSTGFVLRSETITNLYLSLIDTLGLSAAADF